MPFGLINVSSTFQSLINTFFKSYLRKFILVFFGDILMYSKNPTEHRDHLRVTLEILRENEFFAKEYKCRFGMEDIDYFGHVITRGGVKVDFSKIETMKSWPNLPQ